MKKKNYLHCYNPEGNGLLYIFQKQLKLSWIWIPQEPCGVMDTKNEGKEWCVRQMLSSIYKTLNSPFSMQENLIWQKRNKLHLKKFFIYFKTFISFLRKCLHFLKNLNVSHLHNCSTLWHLHLKYYYIIIIAYVLGVWGFLHRDIGNVQLFCEPQRTSCSYPRLQKVNKTCRRLTAWQAVNWKSFAFPVAIIYNRMQHSQVFLQMPQLQR